MERFLATNSTYWFLSLFLLGGVCLSSSFAAIEATIRYEIPGLNGLDAAALEEATRFIQETIDEEGKSGTVKVTSDGGEVFFAELVFEEGTCAQIDAGVAEARAALGEHGKVQKVRCGPVGDSAELNKVRGSFTEAVSLGGSWYWSEWLGSFYGKFTPWIYSESIGWTYTQGNEDSLFAYLPEGGWVWTSQEAWPYLYSFESAAWRDAP
jgi:hypothetical protein